VRADRGLGLKLAATVPGDDLDRFDQVGGHEMRRPGDGDLFIGLLGLPAVLLRVAVLFGTLGIDEDRARARSQPRLDVARLIADGPASAQIQFQILSRLENHPRLRFAPFVLAPVFLQPCFRVVGAIIKTIDLDPAAFAHELVDALVNSVNLFFGERAAGHPPLVGYHDDAVAQPPQRGDRRGGAAQQLHLPRVAEVAVVLDDRVVPIEKDRRPHANYHIRSARGRQRHGAIGSKKAPASVVVRQGKLCYSEVR